MGAVSDWPVPNIYRGMLMLCVCRASRALCSPIIQYRHSAKKLPIHLTGTQNKTQNKAIPRYSDVRIHHRSRLTSYLPPAESGLGSLVIPKNAFHQALLPAKSLVHELLIGYASLPALLRLVRDLGK